MIGVVFGHHKNDPYAFDRLYKYKIDKSENYVEFKSAITNNEILIPFELNSHVLSARLAAVQCE